MTTPDTAIANKPTVDEDLVEQANALLEKDANGKRLSDLEDLKDRLKEVRDRERDAVIKEKLTAVLNRVLEAISQGYYTDTGHRWPR